MKIGVRKKTPIFLFISWEQWSAQKQDLQLRNRRLSCVNDFLDNHKNANYFTEIEPKKHTKSDE